MFVTEVHLHSSEFGLAHRSGKGKLPGVEARPNGDCSYLRQKSSCLEGSRELSKRARRESHRPCGLHGRISILVGRPEQAMARASRVSSTWR